MRTKRTTDLTRWLGLALLGLAVTECDEVMAAVYEQPRGANFIAFEADAGVNLVTGTPENWVSAPDAAASGGTALYASGNNSTGDSPHSFAQYSLRFRTAGSYYIYYRWKADPARTAGDAFTANSTWFGSTFGAYSAKGDQSTYYRSSSNDATAPADNVYEWKREAETVVYTVSAADAAGVNPLVFTLGTREAGMFLDRFVFSTSATLTPAELDALINTDTDIVLQKPVENFVAFEAEGVKAKVIEGTPENWAVQSDPDASGGAVLYASGNNSTGDSPHSFAQYSIQFAKAGTYYLYYRWKADAARTAGDAFTANSTWFGATFGAYSTKGDQSTYYRSSSNDATAPADNVFEWRREPETVTYTVGAAEAAAGAPLVFTIGTREAGMAIDRFVFSTSSTLTGAELDALVNSGATPTAPKLDRAVGSAALTTVDVTFTRPLAAGSVAVGRFALDNGASVTGVQLDGADARVVHLTTSAQVQGTVYTLTVNGVTDTGGTAIAANSKMTFSAWKVVEGWALKEVYFGITAATVAEFVADPKYPSKPDRVEWVKGFQLNDAPLTDNYGARLTAYFTPSTSGVHSFYVNNDDEAELQLSPNESESGLVSLGIFPTSPRVFDLNQPIDSGSALVAGRRYLLRGLLKQQTGPVYLNVAARAASTTAAIPVLAGGRISTWVNPDIGTVTFTKQPADVAVTEGASARFSVSVETKETPVYYQWRENGAPILGATRAAYVVPAAALADSGKMYDVVVSVAGKDTASAGAKLTVRSGDPSPLQPFVGINFVGGGTFGGDALASWDVAGVVPQANWNNLDGFVFDPASTPQRIVDASGKDTAVTVTAAATGVWYTGARATGDADGALLQGFIHWGTSTEPSAIELGGVPSGTYNVLVYSAGFDFSANYFQAYGLRGRTTPAVVHGKADRGLDVVTTPGFRRMTSTSVGSPSGGNYVQFDNVSPAADGTLGLTVTWEPADPAVSNGYQPAVSAVQLVKVVPVTVRPTLGVSRTAAGLSITWGASASGFVLESSPVLGGGATWARVSATSNPLADAGSTAVTAGSGAVFYRLRRP